MVTKEWSPAMLEHDEFSKVGIDTKPKGDEQVTVVDGSGNISTIGHTSYSIDICSKVMDLFIN